MSRRLIVSPALVLLLAACEGSSTPPSDDPGAGPGVEVPTPEPGSPTPVVKCPEGSGPTLHSGDIEADETWRAEDGPHIVLANLRVREGRTLTIAPCAKVLVAEGADITVAFPGTPGSGTLIAEGNAQQPIRIEGKDGARWGGVYVAAPGTARLAYVTLKGGGAESRPVLAADGLGKLPVQESLRVDHVTVEGALDLGVKVARMATFAPGSTSLVVKGSGARPVWISEYALDALPDGAYTGNAVDEIVVKREGAVETDTTMHARGVPYHVGDTSGDKLRVGMGQGKPLATLTIEPGTTVLFEQGGGLDIESTTGAFPASGALVARGTADKPIVFGSAAATPAPGDWRGLWFGGVPRAENLLEHVTIDHAGGDCLCVLSSCSALTTNDGAVIFTQQPPSAFITQTTIAHSKAHGFVLGYSGDKVDFKANNEFVDLGGCQETLPSAQSCPAPKPACE